MHRRGADETPQWVTVVAADAAVDDHALAIEAEFETQQVAMGVPGLIIGTDRATINDRVILAVPADEVATVGKGADPQRPLLCRSNPTFTQDSRSVGFQRVWVGRDAER